MENFAVDIDQYYQSGAEAAAKQFEAKTKEVESNAQRQSDAYLARQSSIQKYRTNAGKRLHPFFPQPLIDEIVASNTPDLSRKIPTSTLKELRTNTQTLLAQLDTACGELSDFVIPNRTIWPSSGGGLAYVAASAIVGVLAILLVGDLLVAKFWLWSGVLLLLSSALFLRHGLAAKSSERRANKHLERFFGEVVRLSSECEQYDAGRNLKQVQNDAELNNQARGAFADRLNDLAAEIEPQIENLAASSLELKTKAGISGQDWSQVQPSDLKLPLVSDLEVRIGVALPGHGSATISHAGAAASNSHIEIPVFAPFAEKRALLFDAPANLRDQITRGVLSLLIRLLTTVPPGKAFFTIFDPINLGQSVAPLLKLADHDEKLVAGKVWTDARQISEQLLRITEHIETVIQRRLRDDYEDIEEFNHHAGEVKEAYRFLVIFDFPVNFDEESFKRLTSIVKNGPRCGVHSILVMDSDAKLPYGANVNDITRHCQVFRPRRGSEPKASRSGAPIPESARRPGPKRAAATAQSASLECIDQSFPSCPVLLDCPPEPNLMGLIVNRHGENAREGMRVEAPYSMLLGIEGLSTESLWEPSLSSAESLSVALGPRGADRMQYLELGQGLTHHALIVGRPGSGKSNLIHVIVTTLALSYSPAEIELYLIDFKKGVEFKIYAVNSLPHARVIAIQSEREFGLSVLRGLDTELQKRGDLCRLNGFNDLQTYRKGVGGKLPRVLLVVDEFQEFFVEDDDLAREAALILERIVRQGRAFGIHIILATQTLTGSYNLRQSVMDMMTIRIALQCGTSDASLIFSDDNSAAKHLTRPGEAIYNPMGGAEEGNSEFQVALFDEEARRSYLAKIYQAAAAVGEFGRSRLIVFEGDAPADLCNAEAPFLQATGRAKDSPIHAPRCWVGEPIAISDEPAFVTLRRQSGSHLLAVTRPEEEGMELVFSILLGLLVQNPPTECLFRVINFASVDQPFTDAFERLADRFPHALDVVGRRKAVSLLESLNATLTRRIEGETVDEDPIFLIVFGLQRARELRTDSKSMFSEDNPSDPAAIFHRILREGPEVGIHFIGWSDTLAGAGRVLERREMAEIGLRIAGAMSADDSTAFLDDIAASKIDKPHRLLLFDEDKPGQLEKFRPYSLPDVLWLDQFAEAYREKLQLSE